MGEKDIRIKAQMLGGFQVWANDVPVFNEGEQPKKVIDLLAYLLVNRSNVISQNRLIEVLWNDEDSDNPTNALKNLVYRLRKILSSNRALENVDCIILKNGTYAWNDKIPCSVDIEEFEDLWKKACNPAYPEHEIIKFCNRAIDIYKGPFLPDLSYEQWVVPLASYYQSVYLNFVRTAIKILDKGQQYKEKYLLCKKAVLYEPYEEFLHEHILKALINMNQKSSALEYYHTISNKFYRDLGVKLSPSIRALYKDMTDSQKDIPANIDEIKCELTEGPSQFGAFYCDYEIFKHLYRLEARASERAGQSVFMCLFTVDCSGYKKYKEEVLIDAMKKLHKVLISNLRKGDVVSRYSRSQFILMLPTITYENGEKLVNRLLNNYKKEYNNPLIKVNVSLEPIEPAM